MLRTLMKGSNHALVFLGIGLLVFHTWGGHVALLWTGPVMFLVNYPINQWYDRVEDAWQGRWTPPWALVKVCYGFNLMIVIIEPGTAILWVVMEMYHHPAFRLKRFMLGQILLEGLGCAFYLLMISGNPWISGLIGAGFGLVVTLKDLEDYSADAAGGIQTLSHVVVLKWGEPTLRWMATLGMIAYGVALVLLVEGPVLGPLLGAVLGSFGGTEQRILGLNLINLTLIV